MFEIERFLTLKLCTYARRNCLKWNCFCVLNWIVQNRTVYMYKNGFNNLQWLMCYKTNPNQNKPTKDSNLTARYSFVSYQETIFWWQGFIVRCSNRILRPTDRSSKNLDWFDLVLWHINHCGSFYAESFNTSIKYMISRRIS